MEAAGPVEIAAETIATTRVPALAPAASDLTRARDAMAAGEYEVALELARLDESPAGAEIAVKACANRDGTEVAVEFAAQAARRHSLSPELHFLHAVLLLDSGRLEDATQALRRVLYLDRSLAMAHFLLGTMLSRRGELAAALRAFGTAAELAEACAPEEPVRLGEGELAGRFAVAARMQAKLHQEEPVRWRA